MRMAFFLNFTGHYVTYKLPNVGTGLKKAQLFLE